MIIKLKLNYCVMILRLKSNLWKGSNLKVHILRPYRAENMLQNQGDEDDKILLIHSCPHSVYLNDLSSHGIKLPDIHLPKFSGKFKDWLGFGDIYRSLIHDNRRLNNIQKFHHLRGALEGTAAASISNIKYTADNYKVAWTTITNMFDNKK
ncbi:hypothetical protein JTB14_006354 [Gonioctena quinquepunctata]|nr:hypothetical protein JTB14_006354 [Gonioctena quinquepunctata]